MTREEARRAAEVMMAYADGKEIEYKHRDESVWRPLQKPRFYWDTTDYRIKQEPTYRPFKDKEECWEEMQKHQPFGWVFDKDANAYHTIVALNNICPYFTSNYGVEYENLFRHVVFADGTLFGIKEE